MVCGSCTKKCNNSHCSFTFTIIEACQSGKLFRKVDNNIILEYHNDGFFRYLTDFETGKVYNPTQDDFMAEYTLDI